MKAPPGFFDDFVAQEGCRLKRALYQSPRA